MEELLSRSYCGANGPNALKNEGGMLSVVAEMLQKSKFLLYPDFLIKRTIFVFVFNRNFILLSN